MRRAVAHAKLTGDDQQQTEPTETTAKAGNDAAGGRARQADRR
jgi:hypothetical protein